MKVKNAKLTWNVLYHNFNKDTIEPYNIFNLDFVEDLHKKVLKKEVNNLEDLKTYIDRWARYHYWCKSECEILVSGLHIKSQETKIDIYTQINMNLDNITNYVNYELKIFK